MFTLLFNCYFLLCFFKLSSWLSCLDATQVENNLAREMLSTIKRLYRIISKALSKWSSDTMLVVSAFQGRYTRRLVMDSSWLFEASFITFQVWCMMRDPCCFWYFFPTIWWIWFIWHYSVSPASLLTFPATPLHIRFIVTSFVCLYHINL